MIDRRVNGYGAPLAVSLFYLLLGEAVEPVEYLGHRADTGNIGTLLRGLD